MNEISFIAFGPISLDTNARIMYSAIENPAPQQDDIDAAEEPIDQPSQANSWFRKGLMFVLLLPHSRLRRHRQDGRNPTRGGHAYGSGG